LQFVATLSPLFAAFQRILAHSNTVHLNESIFRFLSDYPLYFNGLDGADGGTRTHKAVARQRILSPLCLPFHHIGLMGFGKLA
jgi:hypothetical protein